MGAVSCFAPVPHMVMSLDWEYIVYLIQKTLLNNYLMKQTSCLTFFRVIRINGAAEKYVPQFIETISIKKSASCVGLSPKIHLSAATKSQNIKRFRQYFF